MSDLINAAVEWLAATGAPNWIVFLALLTSPWTWAREVRKRIGTLLGRVLPGGKRDTGETD
jgi:hypothetical protein